MGATKFIGIIWGCVSQLYITVNGDNGALFRVSEVSGKG